jgi:phospholipid-binding lipoprotein MlaA
MGSAISGAAEKKKLGYAMNDTRLRQAFIAGLMILSLATLSGCVNKAPGQPMKVAQADVADDDDQVTEPNDPAETVNRGLFQVHEVLDGLILSPIAHIYNGVMPEAGQNGVRNALTNLTSPVVLLNSVLQGDFTNASHTVSRFVINSTIGVAGLFDVATPMGIPRQHSKDFGQTMGVYGVGTGPYIFIPVLGPSDARDALGLVADFFSDPFYYILNGNAYMALDVTRGIVKRNDLMPLTDRVHRDSFDVYATYRSIYLQNRAKVVRDYMGTDSALEKEAGK